MAYTSVHLDLIAYFSASPAFAASWKDYAYAGTSDYCRFSIRKDRCRYDIFYRKVR